MNAMIKDLVHAVYMIGDAAGETALYYVISYTANVVIKREGEFYEVPIKLRTELDWVESDELNLLDMMDKAFKQFEEKCDKISANWKLIEDDLKDYNGMVISQTKIEL